METGTLTSKGQTTIPKEIRDRLGLKSGDKLMFRIEDGKIVVTPKTGSARDLIGILKRPSQRSVRVEEMNEGITAAIAESVVPKKPRVR